MSTYYVRADGAAANKAAATSAASAATSMSVTTFNSETFSPGDTIYFSARGGDFTSRIVIPSSGTDTNNRIYYKGEPGHLPTLVHPTTEGTLVVDSKNYVDIDDMTSDVVNITNFLFQGTAVGVRTHNLVARNSGNQCLQHLNTVQVDHYNLTTSGAADEGLSLHDSASCRVFGGSISGYNGTNWVSTGYLEFYDCIVKSENAAGYAVQPSAASYAFKAHRCVFIETPGSTKRAMDFNGSGSVELINCAFKNLGSTDYYLLMRTALTTAKVMNCTFYSGSITGAVVFNQKAGIYENNIFHTCTTGAGKAYYQATGVNYSCFYNSGASTGTTYITTNPLFVDPANNNFHLQTASPCRGIGNNLSAYFTTDIDGQTRTGPWDLGVDQWSDTTAPNVTAFTAGTVTNLSVAITAFTATDDIGVSGYLITESSTPPLVGDAGWATPAPTTYTAASIGAKTLYPWAKDAAGNVSSVYGTPANVTFTAPDTVAPTVTPSVAPGAYVGTQTVTLTADETATIYYTINGATPTTASAVYSSAITVASSLTIKTLAVDSSSNQRTQSFVYSITQPDVTAPTITAFTAGTVTNLSVAITTFTATDAVGVTSYIVTESAAIPTVDDVGWSPSAPTNYTTASAGAKTLYAWAKDAAGNVSTAATASVTFTEEVILPPNRSASGNRRAGGLSLGMKMGM